MSRADINRAVEASHYEDWAQHQEQMGFPQAAAQTRRNYVEPRTRMQQQRIPTGGAARGVQSGQPMREFGGRRRIRRWLAVGLLLVVTALMGVTAWERAPVPDTIGCPAASEECPR